MTPLLIMIHRAAVGPTLSLGPHGLAPPVAWRKTVSVASIIVRLSVISSTSLGSPGLIRQSIIESRCQELEAVGHSAVSGEADSAFVN